MKHETVLVQIDEFQEVLRRWDTDAKGIAVTPGGFCEVLQGSTTLSKGIIVLTGTTDVANETRRRAYPALFRRFQMKVELGYLSLDDAGKFFRSFLLEFVDNTENEWNCWEAQFCTCLLRHGPKQISIDMIKQFLMRRITEACAVGYVTVKVGTEKYHVLDHQKDKLASMLMCGTYVSTFFRSYALGDDCLDESSSIDHEQVTLASTV